MEKGASLRTRTKQRLEKKIANNGMLKYKNQKIEHEFDKEKKKRKKKTKE